MKRSMFITLYIAVIMAAIALTSMALPPCGKCGGETSHVRYDKATRHDALRDGSKKEQQRSVAMFDDASGQLRTATARPSRVLPPTSPAPGKHLARLQTSIISPHLTNLFNYCHCHRNASPLRMAVSRYYYVIALRHILC